jgi:hypothetical protein
LENVEKGKSPGAAETAPERKAAAARKLRRMTSTLSF